MKTSLISVIVTMFVMLPTACGPAQIPTAASTQMFTLAPSIQDIAGTWHNEGTRAYIRFYGDGTLNNSDSAEKLDNQPYASSDIRFEGTQMSLNETAVAGVPSCGDALGLYEVRLLPNGKIQIVTIDEKCPPSVGDTGLEFGLLRLPRVNRHSILPG